jgi:hypothetical protein
MLVFQLHVLGRQTVETCLLAGAGVEEGEVEAVAAVNYLEKIDQAVSVRGAGNAAELLALLSKQPKL